MLKLRGKSVLKRADAHLLLLVLVFDFGVHLYLLLQVRVPHEVDVFFRQPLHLSLQRSNHLAALVVKSRHLVQRRAVVGSKSVPLLNRTHVKLKRKSPQQGAPNYNNTNTPE